MRAGILLSTAAMLIGTAAWAQELTPAAASAEDYIRLLNDTGYQAYSFDMNGLEDATYSITFEIREYEGVDSGPVSTRQSGRFRNRTMISDFMWRELSAEELAEINAEAADPEKGIYRLSKRLTVGFIPSGNDSTATGRLSAEFMGRSGFELKLKPVSTGPDGKPIYRYLSRPFKATSFEEGKFIPLVLYCSFWTDPEHNIIRCCGEKEIDPGMTSDILKDTPHHFVIGAILNRL